MRDGAMAHLKTACGPPVGNHKPAAPTSSSVRLCQVALTSGVTDGGRGARRPPGKLNVKNGSLLEISWTAEYESASTKFRKSVGLDILYTEILQCLANQQLLND